MKIWKQLADVAIAIFLYSDQIRGGFIGGCTGVRTPIDLGQQECKKIEFGNIA